MKARHCIYMSIQSNNLLGNWHGETEKLQSLSSAAGRKKSKIRCRLFREVSLRFSMCKMICIRKQYFNLNRLLLLPIGLWPDEQTRFARFRAGVLFSILSSCIVFQVIHELLLILYYLLRYFISI